MPIPNRNVRAQSDKRMDGLNGGGTPANLPKIIASPTRPTVVIDGDCLAMVSGTTLTALKRLTSGEWTDVPFDYGTNPGTLHTEGTYYGWFNNGVLVAIYVYENNTIKQVAPGANSFYIDEVPTDEASVGDYWLNIDNLQSCNLYQVQRLEQGETTPGWTTLYNVAVPVVYVQATEPSGAGVKPNAWWIQAGGQSFYDKTIVSVKQYEANYGWVTRCTPGGSGSGDLTINIDYAIVVDKGNVI